MIDCLQRAIFNPDIFFVIINSTVQKESNGFLVREVTEGTVG